jgi:hypothetical protein
LRAELLRLIVDSVAFRLFIGTGAYISYVSRGHNASSMILGDGSVTSMCAILGQKQMNDVHEVDMHALIEFMGVHENFVQRQRPTSTAVVVVRHPDLVLKNLAGQFMMLSDSKPMFLGVVSYMVRKHDTDVVDDPPTTHCPEGV